MCMRAGQWLVSLTSTEAMEMVTAAREPAVPTYPHTMFMLFFFSSFFLGRWESESLDGYVIIIEEGSYFLGALFFAVKLLIVNCRLKQTGWMLMRETWTIDCDMCSVAASNRMCWESGAHRSHTVLMACMCAKRTKFRGVQTDDFPSAKMYPIWFMWLVWKMNDAVEARGAHRECNRIENDRMSRPFGCSMSLINSEANVCLGFVR